MSYTLIMILFASQPASSNIIKFKAIFNSKYLFLNYKNLMVRSPCQDLSHNFFLKNKVLYFFKKKSLRLLRM